MSESSEVVARIDLTVEEHCGIVTINNPTRRNAFTRQMCIDLKRAMENLSDRPDVHLIVVRGAQGNFSAGVVIHDLPAVLFDTQADGSTVDHLTAADGAITSMTKPTVALVEGFCMGGGWQIASACDFIVARDDATFAITPSKIGILYPRVGVERLVREVGPARAKYILMMGHTFTAEKALTLGLIADVFPREQFDGCASNLTETLMKRSRFSVETMKRLVDVDLCDTAKADEAWSAGWEAMIDGADMAIGIAAFTGRAAPVFTWSPTSPPRTSR